MMINILFNSPYPKFFTCLLDVLVINLFKAYLKGQWVIYTRYSPFCFSQPSTENNFKVEYDEFTAFYLFIFGNCSFELESFVSPSFLTLSETYAAILRTTCRFDIFVSECQYNVIDKVMPRCHKLCLSDTIGLRYPYRHHIIALWCILLNVCVTIGF